MTPARTLYTLTRGGIALFAAASAAAGRLLVRPAMDRELGYAVCGVFLLACGASALNQCQERDLDALMDRTRSRPLPSGDMSPGRALLLSLMLIFTGLGSLLATGLMPAILGLAAVLWYNGVYTPLKRRTSAAVLLGGLAGAIPPAIGGTSAHAAVSDPRLLSLCLLVALWQVPHFILLLLGRSDEYHRAGIPTIAAVLPRPRIEALTRLWTGAVAAGALLLPVAGVVRTAAAGWAVLLLAILLVVTVLRPLSTHAGAVGSFLRVNAFLGSLMAVISCDALLRGAVP